MEIQIQKQRVEDLDTSHLKYSSLNPDEWVEPGKSPYKLYSYLSTFFNNTIVVDIGTGLGGSALALSYNPTNRILSYDGFYQSADRIYQPNIEWRIDNILDDKSFDWDAVSLVCLDIDSEDGIPEKEIIQYLSGINWSGILIMDKIYKRYIHKVWQEIFYPKLDVTDIGSKKGTGIINFGKITKHEITIV